MKIPDGKDLFENIFDRAIESKLDVDSLGIPEHRIIGIGDTLSALYQISTIDHKKPQVLQAIAGRVYNHGCGALILLHTAYYDECLNLCRSIGEIANLLSLFDSEPTEFKKWVDASKGQRISNFGPAAVRKKLLDKNGHLPISQEWYSELCESVTHPNPEMVPGFRKILDKNVGYLGSFYDENNFLDGGHKLYFLLVSCLAYLAPMTGNSKMLKPVLIQFEKEQAFLEDTLNSMKREKTNEEN